MQSSHINTRGRKNISPKWRRTARFAAMIGAAVAFLLGFLVPVAEASGTAGSDEPASVSITSSITISITISITGAPENFGL